MSGYLREDPLIMSHVALPKRKPKQSAGKTEPADESEFVWGGQAIADALGCSLETFYYLNTRGVFATAVRRLGHKTLVASRSRLREVMLSPKP
jgi:hypothetical protein